jgi:hypothetical protein
MQRIALAGIGLATLATFLVGGAHAQTDLLYYKFDTGAGDKAINFAGPMAPVGDGVITTVGATQATWAPGLFGRSLAGSPNSTATDYNWVDSGYTGPVTTSFTIAWYMREAVVPTTTTSYFWSGWGSFRCFTGGVANNGLYVRAWGGAPADFVTTTDVRALAKAGWVHIAIVVDTANMVATYYINGAVDTSIPLTTPTVNIGGTAATFKVGKHTSDSTTSSYDIDEFRFQTGAATQADIQRWMAAPSAADGAYGAGCKGTLSSAGGPPAIGTPGYTHVLQTLGSAGFAYSIGSSRTALNFDLGLVLPNLMGCQWESNAIVLFGGVTDASGAAKIPLGIPNDSGLVGVQLYNQALALSAAGEASSNGLAVCIQK